MEDRLTDQTQLEAERLRLHEAERRQRILSEISAILLDYVGGDEDEPLRRIVDKVVQGMGDWCAFSLIGPDGLLRHVVYLGEREDKPPIEVRREQSQP